MEGRIKLVLGDCIEVLKTLEDNSVDSIVTDPPYGLSFMNKKWDYDVPSVDIWKECLRVLKPGGHLLSFGGSRTYHRMAVAIEDAGFEVRDQIMWVYGSGFPKSHNIGKAIQKISGDVKVVGKKTGMGTTGNLYVSNNEEYIGGDKGVYKKEYDDIEINNEWEGWGTALKPAHEPICMARKPLSEKSIAENVLKHGTGGINIDDCRIPFDMTDTNPATNPLYRQENNYKMPEPGQESNGAVSFTSSKNEISQEGRFPANIMFECICDEVIPGKKGEIKETNRMRFGNGEYGKKDGRKTQPTAKNVSGIDNYNDKGDIHTNPNCPCYMLDQQSGVSKSQKRKPEYNKPTEHTNTYTPKASDYRDDNTYSDTGGASRFFYCPKVSKKERGNGNVHPTVKPIKLMEYLIKLVTPKGGVVLEPFMGSGSTGIAAKNLGMSFIGIEREEEYFEIAKQRIKG
jgi:site-specific DNA-methyltransferase (adenine-specific)